MNKRITANLYTETKTIWKNHKHIIIHNEDGTLFSQGQYKTKISPSDLPKWFVEGNSINIMATVRQWRKVFAV